MKATEAKSSPLEIKAATSIKIQSAHAGWHAASVLKSTENQVRVGLEPVDEDEINAVWLEEPGHDKTDQWRMAKALRAGWHRARATQGSTASLANVAITWESARLAKPERTNGASHELFVWIAGDPDDTDERDLEMARELARYFILGLKEECALGQELHERRFDDDPYPLISELALDSEVWLCELASRPWNVDEDGAEQLIEAGQRARQILDQRTS